MNERMFFIELPEQIFYEKNGFSKLKNKKGDFKQSKTAIMLFVSLVIVATFAVSMALSFIKESSNSIIKKLKNKKGESRKAGKND